MTDDETERLRGIVTTETDIRRLLVQHAETGVPELVLAGLLRDYADIIDDLGYVPRTWLPARAQIREDGVASE